ncbi:MAG: hypothetical protein AAF597_18620, partial [Bacteroidota bacterium]
TPGGRSATTSLSVDANRTAPKSGTQLGVRLNLFRFVDKVAFTEEPVSTVTNSVAAEATAAVRISPHVKWNALAKWQFFSTNLQATRTLQQQLYLRQSLVWHISPTLDAITVYRTFFPRLAAEQPPVHLLGQTLKVKPKNKPFSFSFRVTNLLNQGAVTERSIDPFLRISRSYVLRPRTVSIQLNYEF